ncbi:MAG: MFS transporter [Xanthobacteraceae bacterium]|jgi:CP family cyanate transporter-like MFS transporter
MSAESAGRSVTVLLLFWLVGACLRITVLAVPPVVPLLHADLHLSETGIGWLSSLPPMLFAIAAVPGALLIARFGMLPALLTGLLLSAAGSAARGAFASTASLFIATIVMGAGISIVQTVMPPLVRAWFPQRIGLATSVYTNGLLVGEVIPVGLTIPLVLPLVHQSWRLDFVVWSVPVLAVMLLVSLGARRPGASGMARAHQSIPQRRWWPDWHDPLIWRLGLILGSVNATYFVTNAFLPDLMIAAGRPDLVSSALTAINVGQLPASFLMLPLAERLVKQPWSYASTGLLATLCVVAMLVTRGYWIVFWAGLLGFTGAVTLILALALPSILSAADDVHRTTAGMFTISYSCAMVLSVIVGWLWDVTHLPLVGFAPIALCGLVIAALASTVRRVDERSAATV